MDNISISLIFAQAINFAILFFLFKYLLWDKLSALIKERKKKLKKLETVEEKCQKKIDKAKKEAEKILQEARDKSEEMIKLSEKTAKAKQETIITRAEWLAEWIVESARVQMESEKRWMLEEMKDKIVGTAMHINGKLFSQSANNKDFIEKEVSLIK